MLETECFILNTSIAANHSFLK